MRKIFSVLLLVIFNYANAQTYTLSVDSVNMSVPFSDVQNDQYYALGLEATLTNNTNDTVPSHWERTVQYLSLGWNTNVCDPTVCYGDGTNSADFNFLPNLTGAVRVDFHPHQTSGYGIVELKFYAQSNILDSDEGIFIGTVEAGNGVFTVEQLKDIKIFPNPAKENLMVAATDAMIPVSIEVYDILGKRISVPIEKKSTNLFSLNVNDLKNGFYFIQLKMKDGSVTTRRFTKN